MKKLVLLTLVIFLCLLPACGTSLSEQEQDYIWHYDSNREWTLNALNELLDLMVIWEPQNQAWVDNIIKQLAFMTVSDKSLEMMNPPRSMTHIYIKYLRAMNEFNAASDLIITGIAYEYENPPDQAIIKLEAGMQYLDETDVLLENFKADHWGLFASC